LLSSSFPTVTAMRPKSSLVQNPYSVSKALTADNNQKICNLRLFAYPSVTKSGLPAKFLANPNSLPSTRKILELVHGYLVPKALAGQIGLAVMSSPVEWGFPNVEDDVLNNGLFISRAGIRNTSICGPRMRGFITRFIGKPPLGASHEYTHQEAAE
jgi:hypothetical protein